MLNNKWDCILPVVYFAISLPIFNRVFQTSRMVIDEEFHLRQGKHYCAGHFDIWDPKITTFPGLYLVSCVLLPLKMCTTYSLRFVSLIASVVNVFLIMRINRLSKTNHPELTALVLAMLPPLYFFAHLYYTDILSVTTILGLYHFWKKSSHKCAAACGFSSVLMRQTNILWVAMVLGISSIDILVNQTRPYIKGIKRKSAESYTIEDIILSVKYCLMNWRFGIKLIKIVFIELSGYIAILLLFIAFLLINGSIVVGDKSAHKAAIHVPQIFYFSIFLGAFGFTFLIQNFRHTIKLLFNKWKVVSILVVFFICIVKFNTIVHPYLLADNRHYTFYIWNRFYGKYDIAKYIIIPVYIFCITVFSISLQNTTAGFQLMFYVCTFFGIALQQLIEIRYFIIPYIIWRLNIRNSHIKYLIAELLVYLIVNIVTFKVFFSKEIIWSDYEEIQRLIW